MVLRSFWRQNQLHSTHSFQENTILVNQFGWYKIIMAKIQCVLSHYWTSFHETIYKGTNTCGICITPSSNISQATKVNALANDCTSEEGEGLSQRCTNKDKGFSPWGVAESVHLTCLIPHKPTPSFTEHFKRLVNLLLVIHSIYICM